MAFDKELIKELIDIGVVKFGNYQMKKNVMTPIYLDLRHTISYPEVVRKLSEKIWALQLKIDSDIICGVPYAALPIATCLSVSHDIPMILRRKEAKDYGTKKILEGDFVRNQKCIVIEDVVSSGSSVLETVEILRNQGLVVTDCISVIDRQEGGRENLLSENVVLHSLITMKDIVSTMLEMKLMSEDNLKEVEAHLERTNFFRPKTEVVKKFTFRKRAEMCQQPMLSKLFTIMDEKKTNLCVAVDVVKVSELLQLAEAVGPHICILKTHVDTLENFSESVITLLKNISDKYNFLLFEDRKFADIGKTVQSQYRGGLYKISDWAHLISCHSLPGESMIESLKTASGIGACILVADIGSKNNLIDQAYRSKTTSIADDHRDFVIGCLSQSKVCKRSDFVHISPSVHMKPMDDPFGLIYRTPRDAIIKDGSDIIVVGQPVTKAASVVESARAYKEAAYRAYMENVISE